MSSNVIAVAADHAGYDLKVAIVAALRELGYMAIDLGTDGHGSVDYPDFADALAANLRTGKATRGVLICGGGIGISIAANRHRHIRAALCHDGLSARLARQHNDANVIVFGGRLIAADVAKECLTVFLTAAFAGGRHARRVGKLTNGEAM